MKNCPCSSGESFSQCCEPFLKGETLPNSAEQLMRSRYTAYVEGAVDYLHDSIHPNHRADYDRKATEEWSKNSEWLGLEIISTQDGSESDQNGEVEFRATYKNSSGKFQTYEISRFEKQNQRWFYVDSETPKTQTIRNEEKKVGRNEPCPCDSGKKYKKCCGR
jgi:SEC-C motif domain protein